MRTISRIASSYMSRVISGSVMPKPPISVVDEPRPVPNSKRPFETRSIIATRSATRAGWFTGGVTLMIPDATWMFCVRASTHAISVSLAEMCEYSCRKWCSVNQAYFQLCLSPTSQSSTSLMSRSCSAFGFFAARSLWTKPPWNRPNSMMRRSSTVADRVAFLERVLNPRGRPASCPTRSSTPGDRARPERDAGPELRACGGS